MNEVLWSARTPLKGKPPILTDESAAVDWAISQGINDYDLIVEKLKQIKEKYGEVWRAFFIREVGRLV